MEPFRRARGRGVSCAHPVAGDPALRRGSALGGAVFDGEIQHPTEVISAIKQLWRKSRFSTKHVVMGVGSRKVLVREATLPIVPGGHTNRTLAFQVQDIISAPVEETVLDFVPLREDQIEDAETGRRSAGQEGLLIAAPKDGILTNAKILTRAGLTVTGVDLSALALSRVLTGAQTTGTTAILNIGANTTQVVLVTDGTPQFVRVIPNGGDDITRTLAQLQDLSFVQAEALKIRLGLYAVQGDKAEIEAENSIRESVAALLGNVQGTIGYYTSKYPERTIERIVLSGGGSRLGGLSSVLQDAQRVPVEYANPFGTFTLAGRVDQAELNGLGPELAALLGLTIGGGAMSPRKKGDESPKSRRGPTRYRSPCSPASTSCRRSTTPGLPSDASCACSLSVSSACCSSGPRAASRWR
ncbi:type IV pilus assembly protein PilM [Leucobacter soli]|uniref:type IV pilus assembly protein PilM n=1 Tax=Leucobacter soli TaxID=2812850 RepID=UPI003606271A